MLHHLTRRTALLVEDDWLIREALAEVLRQSGWQVAEAVSAEDAFENLNAHTALQLLVTDISLAGEMSGWGLAEAVVARFPDVVTIYISGGEDRKERHVPRSAFLRKPFPAPAVLAAYERVLSRRDASPSVPG